MYQILFSNNARNFIKKSIPLLKKAFQEAIYKISKNPTKSSEALKENLVGYFSYHLKFNSVSYRIFFEIQENAKTIIILEIDTRENFYRNLKKKGY